MASLSQDLLSQALMLAKREPKHPKQASLRRSISTAYYSLFHFLIEECTHLTAGQGTHRQLMRHLAARSFNHGKMKGVCTEFRKRTPSSPALQAVWSQYSPHLNGDIQTLTLAFEYLQEFRHNADYNLSQLFSANDAIDAVTRAQGAMAAWKRLTASDPELAMLFALSLIVWPGLSGR